MSPRYSRYTVEEKSWNNLIFGHFSSASNTAQMHREVNVRDLRGLAPTQHVHHSADLIHPVLLPLQVNLCLGLLPVIVTEVPVLLHC